MLKIRDIELGQGMAKIIVPVTAKSQDEILNQAQEIIKLDYVDLIEWRADFYGDILNRKKLLETLKLLREVLGNKPLIFTLRTKGEGGEFNYSFQDYYDLNLSAAESKLADIIDVEVLDLNLDLIKLIQAQGCYVIGSKHDFNSTPEPEEIIKILHKAKEFKADILKAAFMANSEDDLLILMNASAKYHAENLDDLIITISMGDFGKLSRVLCHDTGSCATFAAVKVSSAPGQIEAISLKRMLAELDKSDKKYKEYEANK